MRCCIEASNAGVPHDIVTLIGLRAWDHLDEVGRDGRELTVLSEVTSFLLINVCDLI